jgi:hypothetical protein
MNKYTYRIFKTQLELDTEMRRHNPENWIKDEYNCYKVVGWNDDFIRIKTSDGSSVPYTYSWEEAFEKFTFIDGEPFGTKGCEEDKYNIVRYFNDLKDNNRDCECYCPFYEECKAMNDSEAGLCDYITLHWEDIND